MREFSEQGYRLLMLACDFSPEKNFSPKKIDNLTFVGVVAIMDAIRSEVLNSVKIVRNAGIKPVMITGDHKDTAIAIAKKVGIFEDGDMAVVGKEIFEMSDDYVTSILDKVSVFARVSPEDKMRIIELYKKAGLTIAMTGDGINDALSLTAADLGIAMGQDGTEVAKEAADIILLDDNFGNIVQAAEEGRNIYLTIKKSILFLLSTNMGEICVISLSIIFSLPLPIIATQIIWLNLVTDASLVTTLAFDKKEKNLLLDKYKKPGMFIVDKEMLSKIFMVALIMTSCAMFIFSKYIDLNNMEKTWTMVLTMLSVIQWFNIFNVRSEKKTVFSKNLFSNPYLLIGLFVAVSLHLFAVYTPFMQDILKLSPLNLKEWFLILSLGSIIIIVEEIRKYFYRRNSANNIY
jgi:Ca2+-transporting ATPase